MIAQYEAPDKPAELFSPRLYGTGLRHKHLTEMQKVAGLEQPPVFCPVVDDYYKGMATTIQLHNRYLRGQPTAREICHILAAYYAGQPLVSVRWGGMPPTLPANALAGTDRLELVVCGHEEQTIVTALFDNLGKGASGAAVQNMNLMLGFEMTAGLALKPHRRAVPPQQGVSEHEADTRRRHRPQGLPGLGGSLRRQEQKGRQKDLALILSDQECAAAAVYTMNRVKAAPLYVTMEHLEDGTAWGVAANSGNANACCPMSHEYAEEMARLAARATGRAPADFVVASTGVIGQTLNIAAIRAGDAGGGGGPHRRAGRLRRGGPRHHDHRHGEEGACPRLLYRRQDRDTRRHRQGLRHDPPQHGHHAVLRHNRLRHHPGDALRGPPRGGPRTFNRVTVDGDTSTNDMCAVLRRGRAPPEGEGVSGPPSAGRSWAGPGRGGGGGGGLIYLRRAGGPQRGERRAPGQGGGGLPPW